MNKRTSYNIPAVLVHEINGTEYRVNGKIVGINEAKSTVSMTFKGYRGVEHDIPMSAVLINEGIIDSLKNAGKKIVTGIKTLIKKVKGFLLPASEDGEVDYSFLNAPVNVAIMEDKGMLADSVHFYANDAIIETAADNGIELDNDVEPFDYTGAEEGAECEKYWARVMKEFVKNESLSYTVSDAIKDVNEKYYRVNNLYKQQALNEAMGVVSLENSGGHKDMYGSMIGTKLLVKEVIKNIKEQTERTIGAGPAQKPIMIWGAPGIGKTVILKEVVNTFKEQYRKNLMLIELSCSALQIDDWGLPTVDEREDLKKKYHELNIGNAKSIPQTWLPVYETTGDPDIDQRTDNIYNSGEFRKGVSGGFDGGVIFFDEYSRLPASSKNVMMTLTGSCMYGGMTLATGWSMIFASNRFQDVLHSEQAEFEYESAQTDRFQPFTYVPTRGEWLRWARMQNTVTGRQNIDEMFCQFIETQGDSVWYGALTTGAFENILDSNQNKTIEAYKTNPTRQGFNDLLAIINDESEGSAGETIRQSHLTVTPRTWQRGLNDSLFDELRLMIFDGHPKLYQSIFDEKGNLDPAALKKALNMLSPKEWHRWAEVYTADSPEEMNRGAICYTNQLDRYDRYVFFKDWLEQHFKNTFGEKAKATTAWHDYNEYAKVFTPKEMTSIWETGDFSTEELRKENNKYFSDPARYMQETTNCKWKTSDGLISEIIERIFDNFPGGILAAGQMVIEDRKRIDAAPDYKLSDFDKLAKKWNDKYAVTVNKKKNYTLITPYDLANADQSFKERWLTMFKTLEYSEFAKMLCNVIAFFAKVRIQAKVGTIDFKKYITAQGNNTSNNSEVVFGQFINAVANSSDEAGKAIRNDKYCDEVITNSGYANMTQEQQRELKWKLNSTLIATPACYMSHNLSQLDLRIAQGIEDA